MGQEVVFPEVGDQLDEFMDTLVENLKKEELDPKKRTEEDTIRINITHTFFSRGEIVSREKEGDIRTSFEREGGKSALAVIFAPSILLALLSFIIGVPELAFVAIIPICVGQGLLSRKVKAMSGKIGQAIRNTMEKFPKLKERLEQQQEQLDEEAVKEGEATYVCPLCSKEFMLPELVSLHLERKHDIKWRELTEEDFSEGTLKEAIVNALTEEAENKAQ